MRTLTTGAQGATTGEDRKDVVRGASLRNLAVARLLGLGLVWLAGFAGTDALHTAANGTRHATGFPCH